MRINHDDLHRLYHKHFDDGISCKELASRIGVTPVRLSQFLKATGLPKPLHPSILRAQKVKEWILTKGGTIPLVLMKMGYSFKQAHNLTPAVRHLFIEWGFPYRDYTYFSLIVGNYEGGLLLEGHSDLPQAQKRINVRCLKCGHEHDISFATFSGGRTHTCSHCPNRYKPRRNYKLLETGEISSLRGLWLKHFKEELPYVSLRIKVLRHGFYKSKSENLTLALLDTDEPIAKQLSRAKRKQYQRLTPA